MCPEYTQTNKRMDGRYQIYYLSVLLEICGRHKFRGHNTETLMEISTQHAHYYCLQRGIPHLLELIQAWVRWIDTHIKSIHMSKIEKYDVTSYGDISIWLASKQIQLILSFLPPTPDEELEHEAILPVT